MALEWLPSLQVHGIIRFCIDQQSGLGHAGCCAFDEQLHVAEA